MPDYLERIIRVALELPEDVILKSVDLDEQGRYWITTDGRLLSVCRERPLFKKFKDNGKGYYQTRINGKEYYLHRLLAFAFNKDKTKDFFNKELVVHHIDRNKYNNNLNNLCIVSRDKHQAIHSIWDKLDDWRVIPWEESKPTTIKE